MYTNKDEFANTIKYSQRFEKYETSDFAKNLLL